MNTEEILIKLGLDANGLDRGLRTATEKTRDWGRDLVTTFAAPIAGLFAADAIKEQISGTLEWGKSLKKAAEEAGVGAEFIQGLEAAMIKFGVSGQTASDSMAVLARKVGEARVQGGEAAEVFKRWGISVDGKSQEEIFYAIADAMSHMPDPAQRSAMAFDLMGKGAKEMAAALPVGADALRKLIEDAPKLSETQLAELDTIDAKLEELGRKWHVFWGRVVTGFFAEAPGGIAEEAITKRMAEIARRPVSSRTDLSFFNPIGERADRLLAIDELGREDAAARNRPGKGLVSEADNKLLMQAYEIRQARTVKELDSAGKLVEMEKHRADLAHDILDRQSKGLLIGAQAVELEKLQNQIVEQRKKLIEEANEQDRKAHEELYRRIRENEEKEEKANRDKELMRQYADTKQEKYEAGFRQYSSIEELAKLPYWRGVQGDYAQTARRIQWLERDAKLARQLGNVSFAEGEEGKIKELTTYLGNAGVIHKNNQLESIDRRLEHIHDALAKDGIVIKDTDD